MLRHPQWGFVAKLPDQDGLAIWTNSEDRALVFGSAKEAAEAASRWWPNNHAIYVNNLDVTED